MKLRDLGKSGASLLARFLLFQSAVSFGAFRPMCLFGAAGTAISGLIVESIRFGNISQHVADTQNDCVQAFRYHFVDRRTTREPTSNASGAIVAHSDRVDDSQGWVTIPLVQDLTTGQTISTNAAPRAAEVVSTAGSKLQALKPCPRVRPDS
jgi:hypothetical protein